MDRPARHEQVIVTKPHGWYVFIIYVRFALSVVFGPIMVVGVALFPEVRAACAIGLVAITYFFWRDVRYLRRPRLPLADTGPTHRSWPALGEVESLARQGALVSRCAAMWRVAVATVFFQLAGASLPFVYTDLNPTLVNIWLGAAIPSFPAALIGLWWHAADRARRGTTPRSLALLCMVFGGVLSGSALVLVFIRSL